MKIIKAKVDFTEPATDEYDGITLGAGHTRLVEDELADALVAKNLVELGDDPHKPSPRPAKGKAKKAATSAAPKPG